MMKIVLVLFVLLLTACGTPYTVYTLPDPSPDQDLTSHKAGLGLSLSTTAFSASPKQIETTITNDSDQDYEHGEYYYIEFQKGGEWYTMIHSDAVFINHPYLTDFGYQISAGSKLKQTFPMEVLNVTLFPGDYRLVKTFLSIDEPLHEISLAVPFTVE